MSRVAVLLVGLMGIGIGWVLLEIPLGEEVTEEGAGAGEGGWIPLVLFWSLRVLFLGGGAYLLGASFFASDRTIARAVRGMKDGL